MSDFVLKNHKAAEGFVNLDEFRMGVLLGFWDRQTDSVKIYKGDEKTLKNKRWLNEGLEDIECNRIMALIPQAPMYAVIPPSYDVTPKNAQEAIKNTGLNVNAIEGKNVSDPTKATST